MKLMMRKNSQSATMLIAGFWLVVLLMVAAWGMVRLGAANTQIESARAQHTAVVRDLDRLTQLRSRSKPVLISKRADADLITRVQRGLVQAGLPAAACSGVQPRADQGSGTTGVRSLVVQVTLQSLTPGEFGAWLMAWRSTEQPWTITEVQFMHVQTSSGPDGNLDSNRFQISLLLSAPLIEDAS